ncbi:OPT oligopeptide transporter protein-domain-containing protein [Lipomyces oligophaga]|uniref:OPT oligopeptide transporter protein-domain-containing protein n=1 Tax=Lipomyces oligophaga TaxID=45792 RepID=UPI0034CF56A7
MDNEKKDSVIVTASDAVIDDFEGDEKQKLAEMRKHIEEIVLTETKENSDILDSRYSEFIISKISEMTAEEAMRILSEAVEYHKDDFNFPQESYEKIKVLLGGIEASGLEADIYDLELRVEASMIKHHSPYPEVRAVTDPVDDPNVPVETIRVYILGSIWVAIGAFINEMFDKRQPSLSLDSTVIQLLVYPCGRLCQYILPDWGFTFRGTRHSLNPGPWTYKEQMLVTVMVNVGANWSNFVSYAITMKLERFFNQQWVGFGFIFIMNFSTQFFGFGLAGLLRRWVVYPTKAMWPTILPTLALNRALLMPEKKQNIHGWTITRYKFFFYLFIGSFIYFWIPSVLFSALSIFNWITWISPTNVKLAIITGSFLGLGYNPITTFDWAVINYSKPLVVPFFSVANRYVGVLLGGILLMGCYWTNIRWTSYLPINTSSVYANDGTKYNISKVLNEDNTFNRTKYMEYSPPYITMGNLMNNAAGFALYTAVPFYILITEWNVIKEACVGFYKGIRSRNRGSAFGDFDDPMTRMMKVYPEVPDWWFMIILLLSLVLGIVGVAAFPTTTPVWSIIIIQIMGVAMMIPTAIVYSITGYQLGMHDLAVILAGYMVPQNGMANMMCRVYGYNVDDRAENYIADQKMAHYSKVPPRSIFRAQLWASLIQTFITIGAIQFLMDTVPDFCSLSQKNKFVCTFPNSLYADSLLYGVVGPVRTFNQTYPTLKYAFLIGPLAMIPFIILRKWGGNKFKYVHPVLILSGVQKWGTTYNLSYYTPGLYIGFAFMWYIRRYYLTWWTKYNYILTSGLTAGVAFSGILIFCSITISQSEINWWGNTVNSAGVDGARVATLHQLTEGETFGLKPGEYY